MKMLTVFLTQILAFGLLAVPSSAQFIPQATAIPGSAPEGINYQGRLEDGGFPVNGTKTMIFRVHSASVGGVLLWTSPAQSVPVTLGLFSAAVPVPTTVLVGGGARYLEVQIDGTLMAPRELLNSVPYALIAKSVEGNIDVSTAGLAINANSTAVQPALYISSVTGNVGVGTGAPITAFDVGGSAQFGSGATKSTFTAAGALNTAGKISAPDYTATYGFSAATATVSNEILIGGGASVATFGLHLADRNIILSGTGNELRFSGPQAALIGHSGAFDTTLQSNGVVRQVIESGGHTRFVSGISASSGTFRGNGAFLESSSDNSVSIFWGAPDGASGWTAGSGVTANDGAWRLYSNDTAATPIAVDDAAGNKITMAASGGLAVTGGYVGVGTLGPAAMLHVSSAATAAATPILIVSSGTQAGAELMRVQKDGNVGIGTSSPGDLLQVAGNITTSRSSQTGHKAGQYSFMRETTDGIGSGSAVANTLSYNAIYDTVDTRWEGIAGGRASAIVVGEGASPVSVHVSNSLAAAGDPITWTEAMTIDSSGNVGIGATAPTAKLDIRPGASDQGLVVRAAASPTSNLYRLEDSAGQYRWRVDQNYDLFLTTYTPTATDNVALRAGGISYFNGGNVGIGTPTPAVALDVKDQGEFGLGAFTQAQVNAKTPGKVGTLILNSAINQVCVSTGTTIMGYAKIRDGSTCQ